MRARALVVVSVVVLAALAGLAHRASPPMQTTEPAAELDAGPPPPVRLPPAPPAGAAAKPLANSTPEWATPSRIVAPDGSPIVGAVVYRSDVPLDGAASTWRAHWADRNATQVTSDEEGSVVVPAGPGALHVRARGFAPVSSATASAIWVLQPLPIMAVAHRAGSAHAPENTLAAIHTAALSGAPWVELDVRMTADRQLVVIHDETLDRTTNGTGSVALSTWDRLRWLDAGSWFDPSHREQGIPTLLAALQAVKLHDIGVVIELKMERASAHEQRADLPSDALVYERAGAAIHAANLTLEQTIISSFGQTSSHTCARVTASTCGWILRRDDTTLAAAGAMLSGLDVLLVHHADVHQQSVNDLHAACDVMGSARDGCPKVIAYTVRHELDMLRLIQQGVDGITSGDIGLLLQVLVDAKLP